MRQKSHVLLGLAELRRAQGRVDEARYLIEQALVQAEGLGEVMALADGYQQLASLSRDLGDEVRMHDSFRRAVEILEEHGLTARRTVCVRAWEEAASPGRSAEGAGSRVRVQESDSPAR